MSENTLSVSELNHFIRDVLNSGFPQPVWVCGEIQGYDRGKDKKHAFFELCEKDPASAEIQARIGLVIFANVRPRIDQILKKAEQAFVLKDDIEVKFLCKVDFYPGHGQVRLIVESIDPIYTLGKIAQDRLKLIAKLKEKGLLDINKRLDLARVPLRIGLITSLDSAAYHDFMDELRKSRFGFCIFEINAMMQGKNAEPSVVKALGILNRMELDAIVITRGGGSIAELACFDSEAIAGAIAHSRIPVLSGIGHEINTTVTDLAAHTFAKTPTAVARFLIQRVDEFLLHMKEKEAELLSLAQNYVRQQNVMIKDKAFEVRQQTMHQLKVQGQAMVRVTEVLRRLPLNYLRNAAVFLSGESEHLKKTIHLRLQATKDKIKQSAKYVDLADPKNTLKRGFSITRDGEGHLVRRMEDVKAGDALTTLLAEGSIASRVESVKKDSDDQRN